MLVVMMATHLCLLGAVKYLIMKMQILMEKYILYSSLVKKDLVVGEIMIKEGLFKDFKIDEVYALHNWPEFTT